MIRILHTIDTTGPGGAETIFLNLINGLDCQKYEPVVIITGRGWVCDGLEENGICPLFVKSKGAFNLKYLQMLVALIRGHNIDVIQSHLLGPNLYCSIAGLICGVPVISTFHGFADMNVKERFSKIKSTIINRGTSKIVFVSERLRDYYIENKGFTPTKSVTIGNGVDTNRFKPQRDYTLRNKLGLQGNVMVGAVGNIRPSKGYEYLLEAAKIVVDQFPHFRFAVVGEGSGTQLNNLLELRKILGLENHFYFLGFEPDVPKFLNNLDVFVLPSISEGFSISTIEAMACGVPVIATCSGGPEEILEDGVTGIMVPVRDPCALAKAIISCVSDSERNKKQIMALNKCNDTFSVTEMIMKYEQLYQLVIKDSKKRRNYGKK